MLPNTKNMKKEQTKPPTKHTTKTPNKHTTTHSTPPYKPKFGLDQKSNGASSRSITKTKRKKESLG
jgi:hypothetical protein